MKKSLLTTLFVGALICASAFSDSNSPALSFTKTSQGIKAVQITGSSAVSLAASITPEKLADGTRNPVRTAYDKEGNELIQCNTAAAEQASCFVMIYEN